MEEEIKKFTEFKTQIEKICSQIMFSHLGAIETCYLTDLSVSVEEIKMNSDWAKKTKELYPDAISYFHVAMNQHGDGIAFYLTKDSHIIAEYVSSSHVNSSEKAIRFASLKEANDAMPSHINFLTRDWNLMKREEKE